MMSSISIINGYKYYQRLLHFAHSNLSLCTCLFTTQSPELGPAYIPSNIEFKTDPSNYFKPPIKCDSSYTMILPPPNITGDIHLGHALTATIQDTIIKWNSMRGVQTVWVPGFDHAGIATQVVVEKLLLKLEGKSRMEIGQKSFLRSINEWKDTKCQIIREQLHRLGLALDWTFEAFTMDQSRSEAVTEAFIRLFNAELIYRTDHPVNWSCQLQSTISDIEIDSIDICKPTKMSVPGYTHPVEFGWLYYIAMKCIDSGSGEVIVATTRPETMFGDVAVAVHPDDQRYTHLLGKQLYHPLRQKPIPIIADEMVDISYGTGAVKLTPAHSVNDFVVSKKHNLESISAISDCGHIIVSEGWLNNLHGMRRFDARTAVVDELNKLGLLRNMLEHKMSIPICSRSKDVVEVMLRPQWFIKCSDMAKMAIQDVKVGNLCFHPSHFGDAWIKWMENIRDWCISRQIWWGHRIPVYYCHPKCDNSHHAKWLVARNLDEAKAKACIMFKCKSDEILVEQDCDVLDTWFSSALQPFSVFGWPSKLDDSNYCKNYPLSLMVTGHDILFFWVARMVMLGRSLTRKLPFNTVFLHGILRDAHGRKMSKSLGNVITPNAIISGTSLQSMHEESVRNYDTGILSENELKLAIDGQRKMFPKGIEPCGVDALRFTLCSHNVKNHYINFDIQECHTNKLFGNKIWQAVKFSNSYMQKLDSHKRLMTADDVRVKLDLMDRWILSRLAYTIEEISNAMESYDIHIAVRSIKEFLYYNFCDIYIESTKSALANTIDEKAACHCWTLLWSLNHSLRSLAPFMPFLAEHLHSRLSLYPGEELDVSFPQPMPQFRNKRLEDDVLTVMRCVQSFRQMKSIFNLSSKYQPRGAIVSKNDDDMLSSFQTAIKDLSRLYELSVHKELELEHQDIVKYELTAGINIVLFVPPHAMESLNKNLGTLEQRRKDLVQKKNAIKNWSRSSDDTEKICTAQESLRNKQMALIDQKLEKITFVQSLYSSKHG